MKSLIVFISAGSSDLIQRWFSPIVGPFFYPLGWTRRS